MVAHSTDDLAAARMKGPIRCWVCEGIRTEVVKKANFTGALSSRDFEITDHNYGVTGEIVRCRGCGFLFCPELSHVASYYAGLEDPGYEETRDERLVQMRRVLDLVRQELRGNRVLDVGAASGVFVEAARERELDAAGVEPSAWLASAARNRGLPVVHGFFPHSSLAGSYDLITLIDVLEHVSDPVQILRDIRAQLSSSGIAVVVTPDVGSVAARLLGSRWWHFRIAHIGYFDKRTLELACRRAGLRTVRLLRPSWHFGADYVWRCAMTYFLRKLTLQPPSCLKRIKVPLNLHDSWMAVLAPESASPS